MILFHISMSGILGLIIPIFNDYMETFLKKWFWVTKFYYFGRVKFKYDGMLIQ